MDSFPIRTQLTNYLLIQNYNPIFCGNAFQYPSPRLEYRFEKYMQAHQ